MSLYILEPEENIRFGTKWAYGETADPVKRGGAPRCPVCGKAIGMLGWLPPHRISISSANTGKWGDFLWGAGFQLMVSGRFKSLYEAERLTGIETFFPAAEIVRAGRRKTGDLPPGLPDYHLIEVTWNGANLDDVASGVARKSEECDYCRGAIESMKRAVFVPGSWEQCHYDVFRARGLVASIVVSERFKQFVERNGLKNAQFIPDRRYAYDEHRLGLFLSPWYVQEDR